MKHSRLSSLFNFHNRSGNRNVPGVSLYPTAAYPTSPRKSWRGRGLLDDLYRGISRNGDPTASISPVLDRWIEEGRTVDKAGLVTIIRELRQYKRYKNALEISKWMTDKRYFELTHSDVAIRLDLIAKVHGIEQAENYFNSIPKQLKVLEVYCALLNCYAQAKLVKKAETTMQKMRDLGFNRTSLIYNALLNLYYQTGSRDKFDSLLSEMEDSGIVCDKFTYGIRLSAYGAASDLAELDKVLSEWESNPVCNLDWTNYAVAANGYSKAGHVDKALAMLEKSEKLISSSNRQRRAYEFLMTQYAVLGKKDNFVRLWELYKTHMKIYNPGYVVIITSLLKLGEIETAEKIFEEWESSNLTYDMRIPNFLIGAFSRKGLFDKAEAIINRVILKGEKPNTMSWYYLAKGYLDDNQTEKAVESMKKALSAAGPRWRAEKDVFAACLEYMKKKDDFAGAEEFIRLVRDNCNFPISIQERLLDYVNNPDDSISVAMDELDWDSLNRYKCTNGLLEVEDEAET